MAPQIPKIVTPLEAVDTVADMVNQVFRTPARVMGNALSAAGQAFKNLEADIARPAEMAEIPPPPDALIEPAISGVGHIVDGVIGTVKGAVDGVLATAEGIRKEVTQLIRR